ncbi:hypothetical protein [Thioclava sp. GXIMD4215]|uniref:hypothetical protein n=1 Tax=Thioclava sp. GXIMD4215 TaxID=3131928 RepID=UPI0032520263
MKKWCPEADSNHRHADFQADAKPSISSSYQEEARQTHDGTSIAYPPIVKLSDKHKTEEKKNPGALAGATGTRHFSTFKDEYYQKRADAATALALAIADCHPIDAAKLMEAALADLRQGAPGPALLGIMEEANFWAGYATREELKAYALVAFRALGRADQKAFLKHVRGA